MSGVSCHGMTWWELRGREGREGGREGKRGGGEDGRVVSELSEGHEK